MGIVSFSLYLLYNRYSFRENSLFRFDHLIMKFITLQFLGVAMLMMLYTLAAPLSDERQGEDNEMLREGFRGEENEVLRAGFRGGRRGQTNEMQKRGRGAEMQRQGSGGEGKLMLKRDGGGTGFGCDLENHLQGGGWIQLLGEC